MHGVELVSRYLDERGIDHEVVEHAPAYSATQEARFAGGGLDEAAKTLVLRDREGWRVAVLPANRQLDVERVRALLGGTRHLRLATENEMSTRLPDFEVGTVPPFGPMLPLPEVVDIRLLYSPRILCAAGDHRHGVWLDPRDLLRLTEPRVGDICRRYAEPQPGIG